MRLSPGATAGRWDTDTAVITPDSKYVVHLSRPVDEIALQLYSTPIAGGAVVRLNADLPPSGAVRGIFLVTPDSQTVIYRADQVTFGRVNLYAVPVTGGSPWRLNHDLGPKGCVTGGSAALAPKVTPDGQYVVFAADQGTPLNEDDGFDLFYTPIAAPAVKLLNSYRATAGDVKEFTILPNSSSVVLRGDLDRNDSDNLYRVDFYEGTEGPAPFPLTNNMTTSEVPEGFQLSADGAWLLFSADYLDGRMSLFSARTTVLDSAARLNQSLTASQSVADFMITPNSQSAAFTILDESTDQANLYTINLVPPAQPVQINPDLHLGQSVVHFAITPDSLNIVYQADAALYTATLNGAGDPLALTPQMPFTARVDAFAISPDGSTVVYLADAVSDGINELFLVSISGPPSHRLNPAITQAGCGVAGFILSPSGKQAVYTACYQLDHWKLFRVEDTNRLLLPFVIK